MSISPPRPRFPARLHVLLATSAPLGVVIRRGPAGKVATLLWHRERDTFELGQWLKGRIYERRCDLSPDGKHLIYFAMSGHWESEARGAWTAISRAPYLKALALFAKGDCWHGGGLFTDETHYWLNDGYGHQVIRDTRAVTRDRDHRPSPSFGGECPGVYVHRLRRDGWTFVEHMRSVDVFERPLDHGWRLRKLAHAEVRREPGKGCYWDEHALLAPNGDVTSLPDWEWADLDRGRVVWARGGKLWSARIERSGLVREKQLFDFDGMRFQAVPAPY